MPSPQAVAIERLGDAAADFGRRELLVADEAERSHDAGDGSEQAEQRRECDERPQHPLQAFAALQFIRCAKLHRAQQRAVCVNQSVVNGSQEWIVGAVGEMKRLVKLTVSDGVEAFDQCRRVGPTSKTDHQIDR